MKVHTLKKTNLLIKIQMATKRVSKNIQKVENDDPITIRPSQLRLLIKETLEESLEKIRLDSSSKEKGSVEELSRSKLESMTAAQVKKLAEQKATNEKVTIRVTGKSKIPTKVDNINFLLQETPDENREPSPKKKKEKRRKVIYDSHKKIYIIGKDASNEKGEVYGRLLKTGKVRPFTSDERTELLKTGIPFVCKITQHEVNKYRKACEKKTRLSSESSESDTESRESDTESSADISNED